jgi:rhamnogalacturonyl hydrolase YesR
MSFMSQNVHAAKTAHCRFVPERKDDFAFENDTVAFRVYGPALKDSSQKSGVDCWLKRVDYPIIDKWYQQNAEGLSYHKDHGEGHDSYHVDDSFGCGGLGLWIDGKFIQSNVYTSYKIIQNGPNTVVFELEYIWEGLPQQVREVRRITLKKGEQLFRADSQFYVAGHPAKVIVAVGLTTHDGKAEVIFNKESRWMAAWEKMAGSELGTAVMIPYRTDLEYVMADSKKKNRSHALIVTPTDARGRLTYFAGYGWSKAGKIQSLDEWNNYLNGYRNGLGKRFTLNAPGTRTHNRVKYYRNHVNARPYYHGKPQSQFLTAKSLAMTSRPFIEELMKKTIDYQTQEFGGDIKTNWKVGTFYTGVTAAYEATGNKAFKQVAFDWCEKAGWQYGHKTFHADDVCMGQTMLDLYMDDQDPRYIENLTSRLELYFSKQTLVKRKDLGGPQFGNRDEVPFSGRNLWWWCDALYMAPPVFTRAYAATQDPRYLDTLHKLYWDTVDHLYDPDVQLFFRDRTFFPKGKSFAATPENEKIFWSRGNGWVYAGLVRLLDYLPENDPYRPRYLQLFREMTQSIVRYQLESGLWYPQLNRSDDHSHVPETSGTSFFCYGLLGGINRGWLDEQTYLPVALKAWEGLLQSTDLNGRLGFAQLVASQPAAVRPHDSIDYTHGAFLLAASELYKMGLDAEKLSRAIAPYEERLMMKDAGWTWYNDERAVVGPNDLYIGGVNAQGQVVFYDYVLRPRHSTQVRKENDVLSTWIDKDDHNNPALLMLNGKLLAAYSTHGHKKFWNWRVAELKNFWNSRTPHWGKEQSFPTANSTYANLYHLSAEQGRIYNFHRAKGWNPNIAWSDDGGKTWQGGFEMIRNGNNSVRPYVKYAGNNRDRIDIFFTDGHPRNEAANSLYHIYLQDQVFYKSDGTVIRSLADVEKQPIVPAEATKIYDGSSSGGRAWVHDLERAENSVLVGAFITSPDGDEGSDLRYGYCVLDPNTKQWVVNEIAFAGTYLYPAERHYAGGICLDPENTAVVYLSANVDPATGAPNASGRYQIFRGVTADKGVCWQWQQLTFDAAQDNLRPFVPINHGKETCVLWMKGEYRTYKAFRTDIFGIGF